jgi:phospholipid/cholesterol/gamma-HCH transport system substrate-binding protein
MPSQQEVKWSQLKVGLIVLVAVALLSSLLFLMSRASGMGLFTPKMTVTSYFANSNGLKEGAPVSLEGVTIGEVTKVQITTDPAHKLTPVKVIMKLDNKFRDSLHKDSTSSLIKDGLVGDTVVDINSQLATGPQLESGDQLPSVETTDIDAVMVRAKESMQALDSTLGKLNVTLDNINQGQGTVGLLIKDRQLYDNLNATTRSLNELVAGLNEGKGSAGKLFKDDELYTHLNDLSMHFDNISKNLDAGNGSAGKLLKDEKLYDNLNSSVAHLNSLLTEADNGKSALGLLAKDPVFAHKLDDAVTNIDTLLANVNAGKGTLGKIATDDQAYNNLNTLLKSTNDLVTAIRADPKKYFVIHMKIF